MSYGDAMRKGDAMNCGGAMAVGDAAAIPRPAAVAWPVALPWPAATPWDVAMPCARCDAIASGHVMACGDRVDCEEEPQVREGSPQSNPKSGGKGARESLPHLELGSGRDLYVRDETSVEGRDPKIGLMKSRAHDTEIRLSQRLQPQCRERLPKVVFFATSCRSPVIDAVRAPNVTFSSPARRGSSAGDDGHARQRVPIDATTGGGNAPCTKRRTAP